MPGAEKDTPEIVSLGQRLFNERKLSANGTQSCNSCHRIDSKMGGVDNEPTSVGAFGKRGGRNSPTVLNAGFQMAQFWDGRAPSLEHQAKGPILNPIEMAMESDNAAIKRLRETSEYPGLFKKAFPQENEPITYDNVARAIAAFERTLVTHDRFDDFQNGDTKALNATELKGLKLFIETGAQFRRRIALAEKRDERENQPAPQQKSISPIEIKRRVRIALGKSTDDLDQRQQAIDLQKFDEHIAAEERHVQKPHADISSD